MTGISGNVLKKEVCENHVLTYYKVGLRIRVRINSIEEFKLLGPFRLKMLVTSFTNIDVNSESSEVDGDIINNEDGVKSKRLDVNDYRESYYRT